MPHLHDAAAAIAFQIVLDWYDGELGHPTTALTQDPVALQQAIAGALRNVMAATSTAAEARAGHHKIDIMPVEVAPHDWLILWIGVALTLVLAILLGAAVALVFGPLSAP